MANGKPNRPLRPRGGSGPGNRRRRVVIDNQAARPRDPRQGRGRDDAPRRDSTRAPAPPPTGPVSVESGVSVRDFSQTLGVPMQNIIKSLMGLGVMKTREARIDPDALTQHPREPPLPRGPLEADETPAGIRAATRHIPARDQISVEDGEAHELSLWGAPAAADTAPDGVGHASPRRGPPPRAAWRPRPAPRPPR